MLKFKLVTASLLCSTLFTKDIFAGDKQMPHHTEDVKQEDKANINKKTLDDESKMQMAKVMEAYDSLHEAFFKSDKQKIEAEAKRLLEKIYDIKHPELVTLFTYTKAQLPEIKANAETEANNQKFHSISLALIHVLNTFDTEQKHQVFTCPMVKMKWLQHPEKLTKVHNPYASNMPHCGVGL